MTYIRTKKHCENLSIALKNTFKNGRKPIRYWLGKVNPMKGRKRPDLSEYNRKYKSEQMKGDKNPNKRIDVIKKWKETRKKRRLEGYYNFSGPNNGNWRGGISFEPHSYEFNDELKLAIKIRDDFSCKICGLREKENAIGNEVFIIHHIDYVKKNSSLDNLVTLCRSCHGKTNGNRHNWMNYFLREQNRKKEFLTLDQFKEDCLKIVEFLRNKKIEGIVPVLRGGAFIAAVLSCELNVPIKEEVSSDYDIIVDDVIDFGITFKRYKKKYPNNCFVSWCLNRIHFKLNQKPDFHVRDVEGYVILPWEIKDKENI